MSKRILVIDDEPNIRLSFRYGLLSDEWEVDEAPSGADAVAKARTAAEAGHAYDLLLLDLRMPGLDGLQVLQKLHEAGIRVPAILVSAHATTDTVLQAIHCGTLDFLTKPVTPDQLRTTIREVMDRFDFARGAMSDRPLTEEERLKLGKYRIFEERYADAVTLFQGFSPGPQAEEAGLMLGILCEITGDFSHAENHYLKALRPAAATDDDAWRDASQERWLFERLSG